MNISEVPNSHLNSENSVTTTLPNSDEKSMPNNINVNIQPKKRGRKPKNITQPKEIIQEELEKHISNKNDREQSEEEKKPEKILKKRGRKPKIKTPEELEIEKIPKKRGRKPKEKVYSVKELPKTFFEENKNETLILHLPINLNEIQQKNNPEPISEDNFSYLENDNNFSQTNLPTQNNLLENNEDNSINYQELLSFDEIKEQPQYDDIQSVNDNLNEKMNTFVSSSIDKNINKKENQNSLENILEKKEHNEIIHNENIHDDNEQTLQHDSKNNNKIVGRIAAIIDYKFCELVKEKIGYFGFFECIEDFQCAEALLQSAQNWLKLKNINVMRGPIDGRVDIGCGFLYKGFGSPSSVLSSYTPEYYISFVEKFNMKKVRDFISYYIDLSKPLPQQLKEKAQHCKDSGIKIRPFNRLRTQKELNWWINLFLESFTDHWGFVPTSTEEVRSRFGVKQIRWAVDQKLFLIAEYNELPVAFLWSTPEYNQIFIFACNREIFFTQIFFIIKITVVC